jgi:predicted KAP-like P-loop ATPase
MISPDSPIQSSRDDLLGRSSFASSLTKAVAGVSGSESFVVGLHGKWGTGKSSVLNLLVEHIEQFNRTAPDEQKLFVMRFNPWNFTDQHQLVFQFLRQYRAHLQQFRSARVNRAKELVDTLDDYADALAPPLELLPYGSLFSSTLKLGARGARKLLGSAKDVGALFDQLSADALKMKRKTVVLIDDIDRLTASETRQIFQLVKLTARFPYVVYVLAFDREAVAKALKGEGVDAGNEYLEKIVQVSFDLPSITAATLNSFITEGVDHLLNTFQPAHFDMQRFGNLFHAGFRQSFSSVRHVRRFLNGLEFTLALIGNEVNGVDIIGIEALRIFYPQTYEIVRTHKDVFAGGIDLYGKDAAQHAFKGKVDQLLSTTGESNDGLKELLTELFPKLQYAFGGTAYGDHSEAGWEKSYRVASGRYFEVYFQLSLGSSEVSVREVSLLMAECGDESGTVEKLRAFQEQGKLKAAMDSLRFQLDQVDPANLPTLLAALLIVGDAASESGAIFAHQIPESWHVRWTITDVLDLIPQPNRTSAMLDIAKRVFAPRTMVNIIADIKELRDTKNKYREFTHDVLDAIKTAIVTRIKQAVVANEIPEKSDTLSSLLYAWGNWGDEKEAKEFVTAATNTVEKLLNFLNSFIHQTHSSGGHDRLIKTHNRVAMKQLSMWLDLDNLYKRLLAVDLQTLDQSSRETGIFVRDQLKMLHDKGLTPEQFENSRFFED